MQGYDEQLLREGRTSYIRKLTAILTTPIYRGFLTIYQDAKKSATESRDLSKTLTNFQGIIRLIPQWTPEKRAEIVRELRENIRECDFIDELLAAVFITEIRIMTAAKIAETPRKINLIIPSFEKFIHNAYVQCARAIWKAAFLFLDIGVQPIEQQRNLLKIEEIIREQLQETVDKMVPTREILKSFLSETIEPQGGVLPSGEDDISKDIGKAEEEQIRNLVKKEIETFKTVSSAVNTNTKPENSAVSAVTATATLTQEDSPQIPPPPPPTNIENTPAEEEPPMPEGRFASAKIDSMISGGGGNNADTTAPMDDIFDDIRSISQFGVIPNAPSLEKLEILKNITSIQPEEIERLDASTPAPPPPPEEDEPPALPPPMNLIPSLPESTQNITTTWGNIETTDAPIEIAKNNQPVFDLNMDDFEIIE